MKIITIANQKGGVSKTTTALALLDGLAERGFRVLGVDLDGQSNLTIAAGADMAGPSALGIITGELEAQQAIQHAADGVDLIPASRKLTNADALIETGEELKDALAKVSRKYDYCVIDTPPALCKRTLSALIASDTVIIPARADLYSLQGIDELGDTIAGIQATRNKSLTVAGILLTACKSRTALHRDIAGPMEKLADDLGTALFDTCIRDSVKASEAQFSKAGLFKYAPRAGVTQDYREFISELLERVNNGK
jgi:chromosome partitioning protein